MARSEGEPGPPIADSAEKPPPDDLGRVHGQMLGAVVGALLPCIGGIGAAFCDDRCGPLIGFPLGVLWLIFLVFPSYFLPMNNSWLMVGVVIGLWAMVGAVVGGTLGATRR